MTRKQRFDFVIAWFSEHAPDAETELIFDNPYQLLVSVILSAQCTDKRVNMVTPAFFAHFPGPGTLAKAHFDEVFPFIRSISYPNNKTKHLIGMANMLVTDFKGEVPLTVEELTQTARCRQKNGQCNYIGNRPATQYGGRYPCVPCFGADRSHSWRKNPACRRKAAYTVNTQGTHTQSTSLAHPAWPLYLRGQKSEMCDLRIEAGL